MGQTAIKLTNIAGQRPDNIPGYLFDNNLPAEFVNLAFILQGQNVPYFAMNLNASEPRPKNIEDWRNYLLYINLVRSDGEGDSVEILLPLGADTDEYADGRVGDSYTIRLTKLQEYLDLLQDTPLTTSVANSENFTLGGGRTELHKLYDWFAATYVRIGEYSSDYPIFRNLQEERTSMALPDELIGKFRLNGVIALIHDTG